jgi:nucleotide-binding universal stress UspA family protein
MRLLCATDLLPKSEMAIERAAMLANRPGACVTLVHVVVPSKSGLALEAKLQSAISLLRTRARPRRRRRGAGPEVVVRVGAPARRIVEETTNLDADLVVLGPHRKRGPRVALGGTIAESLLRARSTPVLIVKREPRHVYRKIVLAVDLSRVSAESLWAAERLILTPDENSVIVNALDQVLYRLFASYVL